MGLSFYKGRNRHTSARKSHWSPISGVDVSLLSFKHRDTLDFNWHSYKFSTNAHIWLPIINVTYLNVIRVNYCDSNCNNRIHSFHFAFFRRLPMSNDNFHWKFIVIWYFFYQKSNIFSPSLSFSMSTHS